MCVANETVPAVPVKRPPNVHENEPNGEADEPRSKRPEDGNGARHSAARPDLVDALSDLFAPRDQWASRSAGSRLWTSSKAKRAPRFAYGRHRGRQTACVDFLGGQSDSFGQKALSAGGSAMSRSHGKRLAGARWELVAAGVLLLGCDGTNGGETNHGKRSSSMGSPATRSNGTSNDAGSDASGAAISASIGTAGGLVRSADGRVTLRIPAGALTADTVFTIVPASSAPPGAIGRAYDLGPEGTPFMVPATITVSYDAALLGTLPGDAVVLATAANGTWTPQPGSLIDPNAHVVSALTTHLSQWAITPQRDMGSCACTGAISSAYRECCGLFHGLFVSFGSECSCCGAVIASPRAPYGGDVTPFAECMSAKNGSAPNFCNPCLAACCVANGGSTTPGCNCVGDSGSWEPAVTCGMGCFAHDGAAACVANSDAAGDAQCLPKEPEWLVCAELSLQHPIPVPLCPEGTSVPDASTHDASGPCLSNSDCPPTAPACTGDVCSSIHADGGDLCPMYPQVLPGVAFNPAAGQPCYKPNALASRASLRCCNTTGGTASIGIAAAGPSSCGPEMGCTSDANCPVGYVCATPAPGATPTCAPICRPQGDPEYNGPAPAIPCCDGLIPTNQGNCQRATGGPCDEDNDCSSGHCATDSINPNTGVCIELSRGCRCQADRECQSHHCSENTGAVGNCE